MSKFLLQSVQDPGIQYEVLDCDPTQDQVTLQGPLAKIVVSWANGGFEAYGYKLIKEDGSDAQLEELQAQLQAGVRDGEEPG